jgi:hypothetical protein
VIRTGEQADPAEVFNWTIRQLENLQRGQEQSIKYKYNLDLLAACYRFEIPLSLAYKAEELKCKGMLDDLLNEARQSILNTTAEELVSVQPMLSADDDEVVPFKYCY